MGREILAQLPHALQERLVGVALEIERAQIIERARASIRNSWTPTVAAKRAGVTLLAGTDFHAAADSPYPSLHQEIELLVTSGVLTPLEAISAATRNPARAMGLDADLGTIAPGKAASLVVLDANPAEDIAAIRTVVMVMKRGRPEL